MQRRFENSHDFQNSPRKIKLSEASLNERLFPMELCILSSNSSIRIYPKSYVGKLNIRT